MSEAKKMKKLDYRVVLTQKMFKTAFLQLLKEKPIQDITIRELCSVAGVNRGTFYSHYQDIYELLEQIEKEMFDELQKTLSDYEEAKENSFYVELFRFFQNNSEMCTILLDKNSDREFVEKLLAYGKQIFLKTNAVDNINPRYLELFYEYVANGCIRVLSSWIKSGMKESVEEIADLMENIVVRGSMGLLKYVGQQ